jgi:hypothetical protein
MTIRPLMALSLALITIPTEALAGFSPIPYLSQFPSSGKLSCEVRGYSSYTYALPNPNNGRLEPICLIDKDLIFTVDGARYTFIEALESDGGRYLFASQRQIDCRNLREKTAGGWKLFAQRPHENWFTQKTSEQYGALPWQIGKWWYLPLVRSHTIYSDWDLIEPPLNPLEKQLCRKWKQKAGDIY